jgi:hypothetical protein
LKIVCNTSPLILLAKIHRLDTLIRLYSKLMIPKAVADEISTKPGKENDQIQALLKKERYNSGRSPRKSWQNFQLISAEVKGRRLLLLSIQVPILLYSMINREGLFLVIKVCWSPGRLVYLLRRKKEVLFPLYVLKWIA